MQSFRRTLRAHTDWLILLVVMILVLLLFVALSFLRKESVVNHDRPYLSPPTYYPSDYNEGVQSIQAPEPKYPPPAKEQRAFYKLYTQGEVQYEIERTDINIDRHPTVGSHILTVGMSNTTNRSLTIEGENARALSIGCIAHDNPYRPLTVETKTVSLQPFETKRSVLKVAQLCIYIGTADSQYYWRIL